MSIQFVPDAPEGFQRHEGRAGVRGHGHGETVDDNVFGPNAVLRRFFIDMLCDADAIVGIVGNTGLVQGQGHHHAAVLLHQREDRIHGLLLAVHGVDHGLAVVAAESRFQSLEICGVQLQGKGSDALELLHDLREHLHLINLRQADIDIQGIGSGAFLLETLGEDIVDVMVPEGFLKLLLARGIDALAHDDGTGADFHALGEGRNDRTMLFTHFFRLRQAFCDLADGFPDVGGGGAAAAADALHAEFRDFTHDVRKFVRAHVVSGAAVFHAGKSGIGIHDDGCGAAFREALHDGEHLPGAKGAVDAQRIHMQTLQHGCHGFRGAAGQHFSLLIENEGNEDGQRAAFLGRKNGCLCFIGVVHGLDEDEVGTGFRTDADHLGEDVHSVLKVQIAHGLQKFSCGTQIQRHIGILFSSGFPPGFHGETNTGLHDFPEIFRILQAIGAEGIGIEDGGTGVQIAPV